MKRNLFLTRPPIRKRSGTATLVALTDECSPVNVAHHLIAARKRPRCWVVLCINFAPADRHVVARSKRDHKPL